MSKNLIAQISTSSGSLDAGGVNYFQLNDSIFGETEELSEICRSENPPYWCTFDRQNYASRFRTPGGVISAATPYVFGIAGTILFVMIIFGALEVMNGANDPKSADNGRKRITTAIIGFVLLFAAFWVGQIIQVIFGINFLGGSS